MMDNKKTFESSLSRLQLIIEELESNPTTLNKMLKLFEEGMELMSYCSSELSEVESRVKTLIQTKDGLIEQEGIEQ